MATFTIQINEEQRAFLERATLLLLSSMPRTDESRDELHLLYGMLADLPKEEAESPGCLHGFTL